MNLVLDHWLLIGIAMRSCKLIISNIQGHNAYNINKYNNYRSNKDVAMAVEDNIFLIYTFAMRANTERAKPMVRTKF